MQYTQNGAKRWSLVSMPVLQVVQHVKSLKQLWLERIRGYFRWKHYGLFLTTACSRVTYKKNPNKIILLFSKVNIRMIYDILQCVFLADLCRDTGICKYCLPDLWVAVTYNLRQQIRRLLEAATQLVQLLLHGEDSLLQLPIGVIPVGTEVAHNHLHLLKSTTQHKYFGFEKKTHLEFKLEPKV